MDPPRPYAHRTHLELSVGTVHSIEAVIHLRRTDLAWWNGRAGGGGGTAGSDRLASHHRQLLRLLSREVLPAECGEEIEASLAERRGRRGVVGGGGGIPPAASVPAGAGEKKKKKGGRKAAGRAGTKKAKAGTKAAKAPSGGGRGAPAVGMVRYARRRDLGEVRTAYGDTIRIRYRAEEVDAGGSATLLYGEEREGEDPPPPFRQLRQLSKRIVVWCHPYDPARPEEEGNEDDGSGDEGKEGEDFARPEVVPLADLFAGHGDGTEDGGGAG